MFNDRAFRVALAEMGTNQKRLAESLNISESTFTKIKKGMEPRVTLAIRIAQSVNRKVEDLWAPDE